MASFLLSGPQAISGCRRGWLIVSMMAIVSGLAGQVDKYSIELPTKTVERTVDKVGVGACRPSCAAARVACTFFDQLCFVDKTSAWRCYSRRGDKIRKLSTTIVGRPVGNSVCLAEGLGNRGFAQVDQLLINSSERSARACRVASGQGIIQLFQGFVWRIRRCPNSYPVQLWSVLWIS